MVKYLLFISFYFSQLFVFGAVSQDGSEINSKQNELKTIKDEITALEKVMQSKTKMEKETFKILQNYDKQNFLLNKVIGQYRVQQKQKEEQIFETENRIKFLENEISQLQDNYSKYVNAFYRKKQTPDWAMLFDSESISQAIRRIFYLKKFSERRQRDLNDFQTNRNELLTAREQLEKEKLEKDLVIREKVNEEKILNNKMLERKKILTALRKDKSGLKKEIDSKRKAEIAIRNLIAKLSEEKVKREKETKKKLDVSETKEKLSSEKIKTNTKVVKEKELSQKNLSTFEQFKGRLIWPVSNGKIIKRYGENMNPVLKTVTLNYGVDIKVASDLNVRSVSKGIVSAIEWIPGYGSIIIVSHTDDYRTVYSHLNEIFVQEGDKVNAEQIIASVGESIDGNILHFEIWNSRENQNPEIWLAKK